MDALKDIWASLVSGVKERTTNPLSFAFVVSWCLWNFKFFVVLFGDGSAAHRLGEIDILYPPNAYREGALLFPVITALIYVFAYPFVSAKAIQFYRRKQVEISDSVKAIEGSRILTREESIENTRRHETELLKREEVESRLKSETAALREALAASEKDLNSSRTSEAELQSALTEANKELEKLRTSEANLRFDALVEAGKNADSTSPGLRVPNDIAKDLITPVNPADPSREEIIDTTTRQTTQPTQPSVSEYSDLQKRILIHISDMPTGTSPQNVSNSLSENFTLVENSMNQLRQDGMLKKDTRTGKTSLSDKGKTYAIGLMAGQKRKRF